MKFCRQCAEYVGEHHKECPNCGHAFAEPAKAKYFCKRCKRELLSKICPIHGVDSTIVVDTADASSTSEKKTNTSSSRPPLMPGNGPLPKFHPKPVNGKARIPAAEQRPAPSIKTTSPRTNAMGASSRAPQDKSVTDLPAAPQRNKAAVNNSQSNAANSRGEKSVVESVLPPLNSNRNMVEEKPARAQKTEPSVSLFDTKTTTRSGRETFPKTKTEKARVQKTPKVARASNEVPFWVYWSGIALALILSAMVLYAFYYPDYTRKSVYSRAEELLNQGHTEAATRLYSEYKLRYPGDSAIPEINERINRIQQNESELTQKQVRIFELMQKAAEAFNKQRYLVPTEESAIRYISEILREDPEFIPALELQNRIVDFCFAQAEAAFDEDRYDRAIVYYQNLLAIKPNDTLIKNALDRSLKLKYVYGMLDKSSGLADAKADYKNLQSEKYKLKSQIREERQRLKEVSRQLESKINSAPEKSTASDKNPSSQVFVESEPMAADVALSPARVPAIDSQWIKALFNEDADQKSAVKEGKPITEPTPSAKKYPVESNVMTELPVQFEAKKLVRN